MPATAIRYKLHHFIETLDDEKLAEIYEQFQSEIGEDEVKRKIIETERRYYLEGKGQSYSWDKVKSMVLNKEQRNGL